MTRSPERAAWLAGDVLLLAGPGSETTQEPVEASAATEDHVLEVVTRALALTPNGSDTEHRVLWVSRFGALPADAAKSLTVTLGSGDETLSVGAGQLQGFLMDVWAFLREELSGLEPQRRTEALRLLWSSAAPSLDRGRSFLLARLLASVHQELRPALPAMIMTPDEPNVAHIDMAYEVNPRALWVKGWMHDRDGTATRLTMVAPEGGRAELLPLLVRHRRADIDKFYGDKRGVRGRRHGFIRYVELDGPSYISTGWLLELEMLNSWAVQVPVVDIERDPVKARESILQNLRYEPPGSDELMRDHVHPAIAGIQEGLRGAAAIETVVQFGTPPSSPSVSVIVPLFKRLTFLEYQMAHWASDPQMPSEDLIYVLDSPEDAEALDELARGLHSIYGIPFRIAVMKGNAGFAGANNCAAELARADKLLLLNSDVVPDTPGWLARMSAFYDATPNIGALGPKLLYEDESLQHAGMYFHRAADSSVWQNLHYFKGQHRLLPAANVARQVPAVTGACLMIRRDLYEQVGGLSYRYVQGGYEDSDFCLRLMEEGREHWYMPGAELYHLEDQSYPKDDRKRTTVYNTWLHTQIWNEQMERLMQQHPGLNG